MKLSDLYDGGRIAAGGLRDFAAGFVSPALRLGVTGLSRDVSWGLYVAQFTFFVGVAASAVVVVLPYYLHDYREFGRLTILGTDGYIEIRKNIDIAGRPGGSHLFLVDKKETKYIDCASVALPYGEQLVNDIVNRTDTAMTQAHCFLATELVLKAQNQAQRVGAKS